MKKALLLAVIGTIAGCGSDVDLNTQLSDYKAMPKADRMEYTEKYIAEFDLPKEIKDGLHRCLTHYAHTKSEAIPVQEALGWCAMDYKLNPALLDTKFIDYDVFLDQFSLWNGSHSKLEELIISGMNDPKSYEHIETRYRVVNSERDGKYAVVITTFTGKNSFGGTVKNSVSAKVDLVTGEILEVIQ